MRNRNRWNSLLTCEVTLLELKCHTNMRDYLTNRYKKAVLEEFIIEHLKDFRTKEGLSIVSVDISTMLSGSYSVNLTLVYESEFFDEHGNKKFDYASQKLLVSLSSDDRMVINGSSDTSDAIRNILTLFRRELSIDKIV